MPNVAEPEVQPAEKYWAFISYSHRDHRWGEWLHRALETFRVPPRLVGTVSPRGPVPLRLFPTFRDREELPVSADLSQNIDAALRLSRNLVVICSPASAKSRWVNEEILTFKRLGRGDRILALIVGGEPHASDGRPGVAAEEECFPPALRFALGPDGQLSSQCIEPIAADARPDRDGRENSFLKLVAGILGINFDDLRQREHERKLRRLRLAIAASTFLLLVFAALGIALYVQRNYARLQKERAEAALQQTRETLSRSDYLQAVEAADQGESPQALAFLSRAVRTNPRNSAATEVLLSLLKNRTWWLPAGEPVPLGDETGAAMFDRRGGALFIADGANDWRILDPATGATKVRGKTSQGRTARAGFSRDGKKIAIPAATLEAIAVQVWDAQTGAVLSEPFPVRGAMTVAFSPDGKNVLTAGASFIEEHDAQTGAESRPVIDQGELVSGADYTPDGAEIVSIALFQTFFWKAEERQLDGESLKHDGIPQSFTISSAGDKMATVLPDYNARLFSLPDRTPMGEPIVHRSDITEIRFSADGETVLTASNDKTAAWWDANTGVRRAEPMRHDRTVIAGAFAPADGMVFTVSGGMGRPARLHRWSLNRPPAASASLQHDGRVLALAYSRDGRRLIAGCDNGSASVWEARSHTLVAGPLAHENEVAACAFSPDGGTIAIAAGAAVSLYDAASAKAKIAPLAHDGTVTAVAFSSDGRRLLSASLDGAARLWNAADGSPAGSPMRHEDGVVTAEFSPGGDRIVTGASDGTARLWSAASTQPLGEPMHHGAAVTVAHFSPDGRRVVTGGKDAVARVWDAHTGGAITPPLVHDREVTEAIFSADSRTIATAAGELAGQGASRTWDAETGRPLTDPMPHPDGVTSAALHADGRLVTGAFDGMLHVWDLQTGKPRSVPIRFPEPIVRVALAPGAAQLAIASGNTVTLIELVDSRVDAPEWLAVLAERVGGLHFNTNGLIEAVPERTMDELRRSLREHEPRNDYERFGRWFLGDSPPVEDRP